MSRNPIIHAEISLGAIKHNVSEVRRIIGRIPDILAVVKANAYGHGDLRVAKTLINAGVEQLAVGRIEEAISLRGGGIPCPILLLGHTNSCEELVSLGLKATVQNYHMAAELNSVAAKLNKKVKVHLKIDTGMNRLGFVPDAKPVDEISKLFAFKNIEIEGIFTHFADADNSDVTYTKLQIERFNKFVTCLDGSGLHIPVKHAANSAAIIGHPETHLNAVRPGLILYGLYPTKTTHSRGRLKLLPALALKTQVVNVKSVAKGGKISYGGVFTTKRQSRIATLPIGYADGFTRMLDGGEVLISGKRAPIVGRICMDLCMVDVTDIPGIKIGDEAVIYGSQGDETISVEDAAKRLGTISYEILCMLSSRIPRTYVD